MRLRTDRQRGILSKADREFLINLGDGMEEQSKLNARQRIRDRIRNGLEDFDFLIRRPQRRDFQTISDDVSRGSRLYRSLCSTVAFCFRLAEYAGIDPAEVVERAVRTNEPFAENVAVDIDYDVNSPVSVDAVTEQIEAGELPSPHDVGIALGHEALTSEHIERLGELVEQADEWGPGAWTGKMADKWEGV